MTTQLYRLTPGMRVQTIPESRRPLGTVRWTFNGWQGVSATGQDVGPAHEERLNAAREVVRAVLVQARPPELPPKVPAPIEETPLQRRVRMRAEMARYLRTTGGKAARVAATQRVRTEALRIVRALARTDLANVAQQGLILAIRWSVRGGVDDSTGHAVARTRRVVVTLSTQTPWWEVQWLLTHELAHLVQGTAPRGSGRKRVIHGPKWQEAFCRIAERAHDVGCWAGLDGVVRWSRTTGVDGLLRTALQTRTDALLPMILDPQLPAS